MVKGLENMLYIGLLPEAHFEHFVSISAYLESSVMISTPA